MIQHGDDNTRPPQAKLLTGLSASSKHARPTNRFRLGWYITLILIIGLCILASLSAENLLQQSFHTQERQETFHKLSMIRSHIESNLAFDVQSARGLATAVQVEPNLTQTRFEQYAQSLVNNNSRIINVGAAPNMVIHLVHPLPANRGLIGFDYRTKPEQYKDALSARDTG